MKLLNHYFSQRQKQRGVGLLEILIALAISSIMLLAITYLYGQFISASSQQKEQSLAQDQANFAFLALNRAVRMSGAGLCVRPTVKAKTYFHQVHVFDSFPKLLQNQGLAKLSPYTRLRSFDNPTKELLGITAEDYQNWELPAGSEALLVIYSDSNTRRIDAVTRGGTKLSSQAASIYDDRRFAEDRQNRDDIIFYDDNATPNAHILDTWVMVSDCEHTGVYKYPANLIENAPRNALPNPDGNFRGQGFLYNFSGNGQASLASRLYAKLFFIAKDKKSGISHLYMRDLLAPDNRPQPVSAYVHRMEVEYLNIDKNEWVNSASRNAKNNWDKNWPVRVSLYMYVGKKDPVPPEEERIYRRILDVRN